MPKFCPICGSPLNNKKICECGYNVETGESKDFIPVKKEKDIKESGDIVSYCVSSSGGMMGCFHSLTLSFKDKNIITTDQEWHHADRITKIYKVDDDVIDKIIKLITDNKISTWRNLPQNKDLIACDAPTGGTTFSFENYSILIDYITYLDDKKSKIVREISSLVTSQLSDDRIEKEKVIKNENPSFNKFMGMGMNIITDKKEDDRKPNKKLKFCPECGSPLYEGMDRCEVCGYEIPKEFK